MPLVVSLLVLVFAAGWRIAAVHAPALSNFAPLMALTFCAAVYVRDKRLWLVPFAALLLSDVYLDYYHATTFGETWSWPSMAVRVACFAIALPIGSWVAQHKGWLTLLGGTLGGALFFYVATNTDAWVRDPLYAKTLAGWVQALTVGRPEFPPTIWFFRNTLASDLIFTAVFAGAMELAALRSGQPSLLARRAAA
ncbi:MAG: hypothetical protein Q8N18_04990 [Opitutaceae bacterium]|nr:hypothetical protein [Opitutaceae bacterium]